MRLVSGFVFEGSRCLNTVSLSFLLATSRVNGNIDFTVWEAVKCVKQDGQDGEDSFSTEVTPSLLD